MRRGANAANDLALRGADAVQAGTKVYRVWGDGAKPLGRSWTTADPRSVSGYRGAAGLPKENTGRFVSEGILKDTTGVTTKPSTYGPNTKPGTTMVPEVVVPDPQRQILLERVSGANPEF